jgi:hypothetical protein
MELLFRLMVVEPDERANEKPAVLLGSGTRFFGTFPSLSAVSVDNFVCVVKLELEEVELRRLQLLICCW